MFSVKLFKDFIHWREAWHEKRAVTYFWLKLTFSYNRTYVFRNWNPVYTGERTTHIIVQWKRIIFTYYLLPSNLIYLVAQGKSWLTEGSCYFLSNGAWSYNVSVCGHILQEFIKPFSSNIILTLSICSGIYYFLIVLFLLHIFQNFLSSWYK